MRRVRCAEFGDDAGPVLPHHDAEMATHHRPIWLRFRRAWNRPAPLTLRLLPRGDASYGMSALSASVDITARRGPSYAFMSDHEAAMRAVQEPPLSRATTETGLSIAEAARRLGVSENAIRQRIKRETIMAAKVDGVWQIFLTDHEAGHQGDHQATVTPTGRDRSGDYQADQEAIEAQDRVTPAEIEQAIERTGDKYVADMRAMFERLDELYRDRVADKNRLIAELKQQCDDERRRREAAESRVSALEAQQAAQGTSADSISQAPTGDATAVPWWQFWKRS